MKRILFVLPLISLVWACADKKEETIVSETVDAKTQFIDSLVNEMTIEEKVGQMTNLTLEVVLKQKELPLQFDSTKMENVLVKHHVGSIQNVPYHAYTLDQWHTIVNTIQRYTLQHTRMKIPSLYCIDAVHGTNYTHGSTLFPHNIGLAATRNVDLVKKGAAITAMETRASGIRYDFSPVLDNGRQPMWPRFAETFGEDIHIVTQMGLASIKGYEGEDISNPEKVAACMKHYVGYSKPFSGRDRSPALIPERELRQYFLPSFAAGVEAGCHTLMVNSGEVNGTPVHASKYLLTDVLRGELGYDGVIISDWQDIMKLHTLHKVAASHKDAVYQAVMAGIDLVIVPFDFSFSEDLIALVKEGKITEERIDESVKRILCLKYDLGLFENPYVEASAAKNFDQPEYDEAALEAARESMTLLKNDDNLLPLSKNKKVLLVGPAADSKTALNGCWSYTWQGSDAKYTDSSMHTIRTAMEEKWGKKLKYLEGSEFEKGRVDGIGLIQMAAWADVIVLCLGEDAYAEQEGNIPDLSLPKVQKDLAKAAAETGKPVVLVLVEGRPRLIPDIEPLCDAVLMAYWPSEQGAMAIAETLLGKNNPSGKLPFTYPRYSNYLIPYDHKLLDEKWENTKYDFATQWDFGHGLSYTTFSYEALNVSAEKWDGEAPLKVSVTVSNTGKKPGKVAVDLYAKDHYASITPAVRRLIAFKKISLEPGASTTVEFSVAKKDLAFVSEQMEWVTEPGKFTLMVGDQKQDFELVE